MQPNGNMPGVGQPASPVRPVAPVGPTKPVNPAAPVKSAAPAGGPTFDNGPSVVDGKGSKKTGWILAVVFLLIVAAGGVGFGVWMMMDGNAQKDALNEQISALKQQNSDLQNKLDNGGDAIIDIETDGSEVNTANYIYVGEWGIKIKVPQGLNQLSYLFDSRASEGEDEYLYINGVSGDYESIPSFVNTSVKEFWLGVLNRVQKGSADTNMPGGRGVLVTSIGDYDYYYGHPQDVISTDENEQEIELKTVDAIQNMLTNAENYSKI